MTKFFSFGLNVLKGFILFVGLLFTQNISLSASGEKFFECSTRVSMFKKLRPGDLLCLVQTKSKGQVAAVLAGVGATLLGGSRQGAGIDKNIAV